MESNFEALSRRELLRRFGGMAALGAGAPLALNLSAVAIAAAQTATDYKALVCIFLYGGNDAFNTVLATDSASWANYTAVRRQEPEPIALLAPGVARVTSAAAGSPAHLGGVLPIAPANAQGRSFALHPQLGALQQLFAADRLAVVSNVGPLMMPTTKTQYAQVSHPKPTKLFSHNDQQSVWQAFEPEGAARGWGGRMMDFFAGSNARASFGALAIGFNSPWLSGNSTTPYQLSMGGTVRYPVDTNGSIYNSAEVGNTLLRVATTNATGHVLAGDLATAAQRSIDAETLLRGVLRPAGEAPWGTPASSYSQLSDPLLRFVNPLTGAAETNPLARQLQAVARMIQSHGTLGMRRQVFFVGLGGFDVHNSQNTNHARLMAQLADGMSYFDTVLGSMGMRDKVTTFTASDFGRSFTSNGDGTDHGWGGHHFVMGASVRGGDIYGAFPVLAAKNRGNNQFDGSPDQLLNGVLLPGISVDQYGATLARWFGVGEGAALEVFPNLRQFDTSKRTLGFMT
jgi:uncharacterized protein (DUF1501 family)